MDNGFVAVTEAYHAMCFAVRAVVKAPNVEIAKQLGSLQCGVRFR